MVPAGNKAKRLSWVNHSTKNNSSIQFNSASLSDEKLQNKETESIYSSII